VRHYYYYGEYQHAFNNYAFVDFEEGLPQLSDEVFLPLLCFDNVNSITCISIKDDSHMHHEVQCRQHTYLLS